MSTNRPTFAAVRSQFSFLKNESGEIGVEKVFLYEDLDQFIQYMSRKVGSALKIGYMNVSPRTRHESNALELADYLSRKIVGQFSLKRSADAENVDYELTDGLETSLRSFLTEDFALYERIKESLSAER